MGTGSRVSLWQNVVAVVAVVAARPGNDSPTPHTATLSALRSRHARAPVRVGFCSFLLGSAAPS